MGFQGLARWDHESGATLEAAAFIDLVANTPMAPVVDLAVLRRTAAVAARRARRRPRVRAYGHLSRRLSATYASTAISSKSPKILRSRRASCSSKSHIRSSPRRSHAVRGALLALREAGIRTVLSELHGECDVNEIVEHGFDELRLAPSLVHAATDDADARRVVAATIALAHALDVAVIAVGVEAERQAGMLLDAGCDYAQGFLFGAIVPAGDAN